MAICRSPARAERDYRGDILDLLTEAKESLGAQAYLEILDELADDLDSYAEEAREAVDSQIEEE